MIVLDVALLSILVGTVLPILVGIVTTKVESRKLKGGLLIALSAIGGILTTAIAGDGVITKETAVAALVSYIAATASYYGVWKPQGVAELVQTKVGRIDN
jgi:hypothetical protein